MLNIIKSIYYELKSYFVTVPNPYIRVGRCNQCGECCRTIYSADTYTETEFKIMQFIYPPYKRFYIKSKEADGSMVFSCKYIQSDGKCAVYKKRPRICRQYPVAKHNFSLILPEKCGYKFVKKNFEDFLNNKK